MYTRTVSPLVFPKQALNDSIVMISQESSWTVSLYEDIVVYYLNLSLERKKKRTHRATVAIIIVV